MSKRRCAGSGCSRLVDQGVRDGRCSSCRSKREADRGTSTERGYGYQHKVLSVTERAAAIGTVCHLCGKPMTSGQELALDHDESRSAYRGVVHLTCNASDGASRGNAHRAADPGG